jgi:glycine/D-amino acid oxidase-like deaminating enzyme
MVVVGAGITGIVAAIELARSGRSVTIIEANRVGGGATAGSLGVLSTPAAGAGFGDPNEVIHGRARKAWHRERLAAQRYLLRLIEDSGADCDLGSGVVLLAPDDAGFKALAATVDARNDYYETRDFAVSANALESEAGGSVAEHFAGALVMPDARHVHPARMIEGLASLARRLGVVICERTEVVGLRADEGGFRVFTNGGDTAAGHVLLATGGYSGDLHAWLRRRTLGMPSIAAATEELPEEEVRDVCRSGRVLLVNRHRSYVCRPSPDGRRLILGGPVGQVPATPAENAAALHRYFLKLFPDLRGIEFTHCWTGMIAATRDARGHMGRQDGAWYAVGYSGLVTCADAGRRVARNILHEDEHAAAAGEVFPAWPLRDSEALLWRGFGAASALRDRLGSSRLR